MQETGKQAAQPSTENHWHRLTVEETAQRLRVDPDCGLTEDEAARRLLEYGRNELIEKAGKSFWRILLRQFGGMLVLLLIAAAAISAALGDYPDAIAIFIIVVLNAALGAHQEYKAERAMAQLRKLSAPAVKVRRGGRLVEVPAGEAVPGDVVALEAGAAISADARLVETANLRIDEAALTGESEPVDKRTGAIGEDGAAIGDRVNMVYRGTAAVHGRGAAIVTATGMTTELGRIAGMLGAVEEEDTPLQRRLERLGKTLVVAALVIVAIVFLGGIWRGEDLQLMFMTAVSLAVAAVPEGLPAVVTIALALGAQRMLKRNALIRRLPAVETLGSVTVICSDKTGTLTQNRMRVRTIELLGETIDMDGNGSLQDNPAALLLLAAGALCNDAELESHGDGRHEAVGDPTEGALIVAAAEAGLLKPHLEKRLKRVGEAPFDSVRKRMTTAHEAVAPESQVHLAQPGAAAFPLLQSGSHAVFAKGAMDTLIDVCSHVLADGEIREIDGEWRRRIEQGHDRLAAEGMRVLAVAFRPLQGAPVEGAGAKDLEQELIYLGLFGMADPPRPEVKAAVAKCLAAGIRPVMITGDHPLTARHIAKELGIARQGKELIGKDIDELSDEALDKAVEQVSVYARVSPEHKLRIVGALQKNGHVVAMTGDGVNDAPALKRSDIGVAMGITGSDVAKEASDMVLRDDNFATIVAAVEEGRVIFDNIRKFVKYLLSSNCGELWVMFAGPLLGMPLPLLPLQILWMNLVTDGPPALALGVEPAERDIMNRPPYPPGESVLSRGVAHGILWIGLFMGTVALAVGWWYWSRGLEQWQTVLFTTLVFSQMTRALAVRSDRESFFRRGPLGNKPLLLAIGGSIAAQMAIVYLEPAQDLFEIAALGAGDLAVCFAASAVVFWALEIEKAVARRRG